jgi:hypothetical protein
MICGGICTMGLLGGLFCLSASAEGEQGPCLTETPYQEKNADYCIAINSYSGESLLYIEKTEKSEYEYSTFSTFDEGDEKFFSTYDYQDPNTWDLREYFLLKNVGPIEALSFRQSGGYDGTQSFNAEYFMDNLTAVIEDGRYTIAKFTCEIDANNDYYADCRLPEGTVIPRTGAKLSFYKNADVPPYAPQEETPEDSDDPEESSNNTEESVQNANTADVQPELLAILAICAASAFSTAIAVAKRR